jgi:hypothetical protein
MKLSAGGRERVTFLIREILDKAAQKVMAEAAQDEVKEAQPGPETETPLASP